MYCDFYSIPKRENEIPKFVKALAKEITFYAANHDIDWDIDFYMKKTSCNIFSYKQSRYPNQNYILIGI